LHSQNEKKLILGILTFLTLTIGGYFIWWKLPLTINRSNDICLGEKIINNIESYQKVNGLPDDNDWETLRKFGFKEKNDFLQPEYRKLNADNFELIFIEGFDGPYLMRTSADREWKEGYPTFTKTTDNK